MRLQRVHSFTGQSSFTFVPQLLEFSFPLGLVRLSRNEARNGLFHLFCFSNRIETGPQKNAVRFGPAQEWNGPGTTHSQPRTPGTETTPPDLWNPSIPASARRRVVPNPSVARGGGGRRQEAAARRRGTTTTSTATTTASRSTSTPPYPFSRREAGDEAATRSGGVAARDHGVAARRILDGEHPPSSLHLLRCLLPGKF
jgi:hypothetical protein